jgi:hypothetical protein
MPVPIAPVTLAVPVVSIVTFSPKPPAMPAIAPVWMTWATPVPSTICAAESSWMPPSVIAPVEAPPIRAAPTTVTSVSASPSVIAPVVAAIVALSWMAAGARGPLCMTLALESAM